MTECAHVPKSRYEPEIKCARGTTKICILRTSSLPGQHLPTCLLKITPKILAELQGRNLPIRQHVQSNPNFRTFVAFSRLIHLASGPPGALRHLPRNRVFSSIAGHTPYSVRYTPHTTSAATAGTFFFSVFEILFSRQLHFKNC